MHDKHTRGDVCIWRDCPMDVFVANVGSNPTYVSNEPAHVFDADYRDADYIVHACNAYPRLWAEFEQARAGWAVALQQRDAAEASNDERHECAMRQQRRAEEAETETDCLVRWLEEHEKLLGVIAWAGALAPGTQWTHPPKHPAVGAVCRILADRDRLKTRVAELEQEVQCYRLAERELR
jgi:hypothetical protein